MRGNHCARIATPGQAGRRASRTQAWEQARIRFFARQYRAMDNPLRAVIFDLGGGVVEWNPRALLTRYTADVHLREALHAAVFAHPDWGELDRGSLDEQIAVTRMQQRLALPRTEYVRLLRAADESLRPIPETLALLEALRERGIALYVLSNMPAERFAMLRARYDFWHHFQDFVISGEIGLLKPEPAIFAFALARFGLRPEQALFIDDHAPNIAAARALGVPSVLFSDAASCRREVFARLDGA